MIFSFNMDRKQQESMARTARNNYDKRKETREKSENHKKQNTNNPEALKIIKLEVAKQEEKWRNGEVANTTNKEYRVLAKISDWGYLTITQDGLIYPVDKFIAQTLVEEKVLLNMRFIIKDGILFFSGKNGFRLRDLPTITLNEAINLQQEQQPVPRP